MFCRFFFVRFGKATLQNYLPWENNEFAFIKFLAPNRREEVQSVGLLCILMHTKSEEREEKNFTLKINSLGSVCRMHSLIFGFALIGFGLLFSKAAFSYRSIYGVHPNARTHIYAAHAYDANESVVSNYSGRVRLLRRRLLCRFVCHWSTSIGIANGLRVFLWSMTQTLKPCMKIKFIQLDAM